MADATWRVDAELGRQVVLAVSNFGIKIRDITRDDFLVALTRHRQNLAAASVMRGKLPEIDSCQMVESALLRNQESREPVLPITHAGQLVALLLRERSPNI